MVVKMMRWRPWPPNPARKYEVKLVIHRLQHWCNNHVREGTSYPDMEDHKLTVEICWKGPPKIVSLIRRRSLKRDTTQEVTVALNGSFDWNEEFQSVCTLSFLNNKDNNNNSNNINTNNINNSNNNFFQPWEIGFSLLDGSKPRTKNKTCVLATGSLNLAEYASVTEQKEFELSIPLTVLGSTADHCPSLIISLSLVELRTTQEPGDSILTSVVPATSPPQAGDTLPAEKDELSALKAGLRKVKILTEYVSARRTKKASQEEGGSGDYPFDSDSFEDLGEGETDEGKEDASVRKSFRYGTLADVNYVGGLLCSNVVPNGEDEDWIYYSYRKSDVGCTVTDDSTASISELPIMQSSKRSILPWRKRKSNFRSPKAKGEPLLKKAYAEEGGDDIDFDRRQLSSDESISLGWQKAEEDMAANRSSISEFGDDSFAVGSWEQKEIISRDGQMKLYAEVFFASIDQRSERAAGESACTALVAVVADWFHNNPDIMPIKSQFDGLIREGSLEWRRLCENETYREKFPDKHFDLETVLQAKIRPISVQPNKSFIGFFHPEETDEGKFDFLHGAMSFDGMWDEISRAVSDFPTSGDPLVYIVSWNDHFFILKVEPEAYYVIDTLGERLYEGCDQAYILKFDRNTKIVKLPVKAQPSDGNPTSDQAIPGGETEPKQDGVSSGTEEVKSEEEEEEEKVVCQGKDACKDYIKSFLASLPIRELLADLKKGLVTSTTPLHRLQIELHYTNYLPSLRGENARLEHGVEVAAIPEAVA